MPAAAVKRGGQALFVLTGCKGSVGGFYIILENISQFSCIFSTFSNFLSLMRGFSTLDGGVKSVDIDGDYRRRRQKSFSN